MVPWNLSCVICTPNVILFELRSACRKSKKTGTLWPVKRQVQIKRRLIMWKETSRLGLFCIPIHGRTFSPSRKETLSP